MFTGAGTIVVEVEVFLGAGKGEGNVEVDSDVESSRGEMIRHLFQPIFGRGRRGGTTRKVLPDRRIRPWFSCFEGKLMFTQLVKDQGTVRVSNESRLELESKSSMPLPA